ncbi:MAG: hypothetical protein U1E53_09535 [Dongiaceae bacterium]
MRVRRLLLTVAGGVALAVPLALACGPDFPWQLLDDRPGTLRTTPTNSFAFEATHLAAPPTDRLVPVEAFVPPSDEAQAAAPSDAELAGLTAAEAGLLRAARAADTGEAAFAAGEGLPPPVRLYAAGAVDFRHGQPEPAAARFRAILALPPEAAQARASWAAYMLGRSLAQLGDEAGAADAFARTRTLVRGGAPDPLGLAVSSLGEEAKLHLDRAAALLHDGEVANEDAAAYGKAVAAAVALYAEQAAHGSESGVTSLKLVAADMLPHETRLRASVGDPLVQRLLVAYVLAFLQDQPAWLERMDAGRGTVRLDPNDMLYGLMGAIEAQGLEHPAGADRLAALAYRMGRYDLAEPLARKTPGPLAAWVRAKLALQRGDHAAAAAAYAEAARAFPTAGDALEADGRTRLSGEAGVLMLGRGEYVEALAQLWPLAGPYWGDVAYIAERVLTADELRRFVDTRLPAGPPPPVPPQVEDGTWWLAGHPQEQLRDLLGRRLVREGRLQDALPYLAPETRPSVVAYADALHAAATELWPIDRAEGWYRAAKLAREQGMAMMGTEIAPDFHVLEGNYDWGVGQGAPEDLDQAFVTDGERQRFAGSAPSPDRRFHYRFVAADMAEHAADLLPPRSQAFAAVLCRGTRWMLYAAGKLHTPDPAANPAQQRAEAFYRRYVAEGAVVPWAPGFGQDCPEPDFAAAAKLQRRLWWQDARHLVSRHRWPMLGGAVAAVLVGTSVAWRRRRRTASAGS